jgi:hypothetical protein
MDKNALFAVGLLVTLWAYGCIREFRDLKRRTQNLEQMLFAIAKKLDVSLPYIPPPPSQKILDLARDPKQRIEAIRAYRQETGLGLKEAVQAIDQHQGQGKSAL